MAEIFFLKGSDFSVEINGIIAGGVISAEVQKKNEYHDVREFLSDKAVDTVTGQSYIVTLTVNICDGDVFSKDIFIENLALIQGHTRTQFKNIRVLETCDKVNGRENAVRVIKLFSEERQVTII